MQRGDHVGDTDTEPGGCSGDSLADRGVPGASRRAHLFWRDGTCVPGDHFEKDGSEAAEQQPDAFTDQRRSAGESLQTPPVAATAERAVPLDGLMTEFAGRTQGAEAELSVNDNAAANAGPDGEEDHGVHGPATTKGELSERRHTCIIEQKHRAAERRGERLAHRHTTPLRREIGQKPGDACPHVDQSGHSHARGHRLCAQTRGEVGDEPGNPRQDAGGPFVGVGRDPAFGQNLAVGAGDGRRDLRATKVHAGK